MTGSHLQPWVLWKKPDIDDLMNVLAKFSPKWKLFGEILYVEPNFMDRLSGDRLEPRDSLEKVFTQWLKASHSNVTWEFLINVLRRNESVLPGAVDRVTNFLAKPENCKKNQ